MVTVLQYLWANRTTVLGYVQVILGVWILADNVFSEDTIKLFVLVNGTVTAVLGHYNNARIKTLAAQVVRNDEEER